MSRLLVLLSLLVVAVTATTPAPAPYPPVLNLTPFLGLHFFYYETTSSVIYEMYVKNNRSLDYHVWLGTVNGAQCAKDQLVDLAPIGDGMVRISYEEPTGAIHCHILDMGAQGLFKMFYRVTMSPAWLTDKTNHQTLAGCNQYDPTCLAQILAWRTAGPTEPQTVATGGGTPVLFVEKLPQNINGLIDCSVTIPSPLVSLVARQKGHAMLAAAQANSGRAPARTQTFWPPAPPTLPIAGFWYRYYYYGSNPNSEHQSFDLYIRNSTFIEMKLQMSTGVLCSKVPAFTDLLPHNIWRITWRGNHNKNFQSNLVKPMAQWDVGQAFTGLTTPTVLASDPHPYGHLYGEGISWAIVTAEEYRGVNNNTAIGC